MKVTHISILFLVLFGSCHSEHPLHDQQNAPKIEHLQNIDDSSWTSNEYHKGDLNINITNHNSKNFSIQIDFKSKSLKLDLNELSIPWKTPELTWVNNEMICISNWWSGPFGRYIFIPLKGNLNDYIYIDKDIELADSTTNTVVFVDTVLNHSKVLLIAENLVNRRRQSIEFKIPDESDLYPFYDSLTLDHSGLNIWMNGNPTSLDLKGLN